MHQILFFFHPLQKCITCSVRTKATKETPTITSVNFTYIDIISPSLVSSFLSYRLSPQMRGERLAGGRVSP